MDDGKNKAVRIGRIMKAPKKALVWQFLDGKYDWPVQSRPETQFLRF